MESTKYPWSPKKILYILCSIPKPLEVHGVHRQSMDSSYLFVKSVDFIQSPWSPHVNPWILCIPWTPQGLPGGLKSTGVLHRLQCAGVTISSKKAQICLPEVLIVGQCCNAKGREPDTEKTSKILKWPPLTTPKEVHHFLGLCGTV